MSKDSRGTKILARTFFSQLRTNGYTPNQIIGVATELIDLVTSDLREGERPMLEDKEHESPALRRAPEAV